MISNAVFRTCGLIAGCLVALQLSACSGYPSSPTTPSPAPVVTAAPTPAPTPTLDPSSEPTPGPTPAPPPSVLVIEIVAIDGNMSFLPATAHLEAGQQVRWHNAHSATHTATQDDGGFDTGLIRPGATSAPITLTRSGTLRYHCEIHPIMVGAVDVAG